MRVHMLEQLDIQALNVLKDRLETEIELTTGSLEIPSDFEILIALYPTKQDLTRSPALRTLIIPCNGLPTATREILLSFPSIAVHNLHYNAVQTAEMAIALMLAAAKRIVPVDRAFRVHDWRPGYRMENSLMLHGKTALVLGYGAVGRHVTACCLGLGMKVMAVRRRLDEHGNHRHDQGSVETHCVDQLDKLLSRAHVLLVCVPGTSDTRGMIGRQELETLPAGAIVVNVGRGNVIIEHELYDALSNGNLAGAGLDVWYRYPSEPEERSSTEPSAYCFHELDNVVLSPHRAGHSAESEQQKMVAIARILDAVNRSEPVPNRVDIERGY